MNESYLELFQKKPYLQIYFNKLNEHTDYSLHKIENKGEFYLAYKDKPLTSKVAPLIAAQRILGNAKLKPTDLIVVFGLGNPHLIEIINKSLKEGQIMIMVDESIGVISPLLKEFLLPILNIPGRHLFCGEFSINALIGYIESLPIERLSGVRYFRNPPSLSLAQQYYGEIEDRVSKIFSSKMSDLLTKFEFERIWVKNSISNIIHFEDEIPRYRVMNYFNQFQNIPALLVSAGPTLRESCELIKQIRNKVFIMACDTALKVLLKENIIPDGVMTLDAQTHSIFHFLGENLKEIPIFADMVSSPQLLRTIPIHSIVHSVTAKFQVDASGQPTREITAGGETVEECLGSLGDVQSGGSVATSAFDLLRSMGFSPIYLIGQDLSYVGREIHSTGTHHNEKWLTKLNRKTSLEKINEQIVRKRNTKQVPSNDGKTVLTDYVLDIYRLWFEESIPKVDFPVYNINHTGAVIKNAVSITLENTKLQFNNISSHNYPWRKLDPWIEKLHEQGFIFNQNPHKIKFRYELEQIVQVITELSNETDDEIIFDTIREKLNNINYVKQMIRRTEIYLGRHLDLPTARKKEILFNSLKKEIKFLKKVVY